MRRMNRRIRIGFLGLAALFFLIVCVSQESAASPWGYQPDSTCAQWLASYYHNYEMFPDMGSAHQAARANCDPCWIDNRQCNGNLCMCQTYCWDCEAPHCEAAGHLTCDENPSSDCQTNPCGVSFSGYASWGCVLDKNRPPLHSTFFLYPLSGCPGYVPPVPKQDPNEPNEESEVGGGSCDEFAPKDDEFAGNPVKVATGNKYEQASDLSISAPGIPLQFTRHYNSILAADGPLGYGWTHSFSINVQVLRTTPTIRVKVKDADGRGLFFSQLYYSNTGEINFYGESGVKERLKQITSTGQWVLKRKNNLTYYFDSNGALAQISDPNGNTLTFTYSGGLLTQASNNFGNSITFQYSGGRISSITDPRGQSISYTYTDSDLTGVSYPDGRSLGYAYANHNMTDKYDTSSNLIGHWDYNTNGRVSNYYRYIDNGVYQDQVSFTQDISSTGQPVTLTRSTGSSTYKTAINNSKRVITETDNCLTCGGTKKLFTYTPNLDVASVTIVSDGQSYTTQYTYDNPANSWLQIGEVTSVKEAAGLTGERTTSYTYTHRTDDPFLLTQSTESKKSVVNPSQDKVITTTYDTYGNISSKAETGYTYVNGVATPVTETTSYQYNTVGQITQIDGPRTDVSDITTFEYYPNNSSQGNNRGRLSSITNTLGQTTLYGNYDGNGNVGTVTDPNGVVTTRTYDQRNRILTSTNQTTNAVTQYSYDAHGNLSSITYPEGNSVTYTYNLADRLVEIRDNLNNKIQYAYDDQGNHTSQSILDPQNTLKTYLDYTYDTYNRLSTIVNPDNTTTAYTYDGRGNVTATTDPRDHRTTFTYDNLSRKSSMTQPFTSPTNYGYDTQDNPTLVTDPNNNSTHYVYDDFGKKYQTISPDTGTATHAYDAAGNLVQTTDANGNTITYTYDALNRLVATQFADSSQNITNTYDSTSVTYGVGRLTGRIDPSGTYVFNYNAQGNMVREDKTIGGTVYTTQYVYNKNGKLTSVVYPTGRTITYTIDQAQRITQVDTTANGSSKTLASSVSYLPFGGINSLIYGNSLSLSQTYDNQYRISSIIAGSALYRTYAYDANGNITSIGDLVDPTATVPLDYLSTYIYENGSNILTEITGTASTVFTSDPNGNTITENTRSYVYDSLNQLVGVWDGSTQIAQYTFNGIGQRIRKVTASGTKIFHYDSSGRIIAESNATGQMLAEYVYLGDQLLAAIRPGEAVYYYHNDHLGTPQVLTDFTGNVAWKASYAPFGKTQISVATVENNFRFPGQYYDSETGLSYNYYRYYRSEIGRYITADPIGLMGGMNLFVYVGNNPVNKTDPKGLTPLDPGCWKAMSQARKECGCEYDRAAKKALDRVQWCEDAADWCEYGGSLSDSPPNPIPTKAQCDAITQCIGPSAVRLACMKSPEVLASISQTAKCALAAAKMAFNCIGPPKPRLR